MPDSAYSSEQYSKDFFSVNDNALQQALDIRKFEIDLYWKRATYFWTFIAATLAGFILVYTSTLSDKEAMSVLLANLGIVFSFGWFCVNRGSKFWQENWEFHLDMLEDAVTGPLYKVVLSSPDPVSYKDKFFHFLAGPRQFSVSKINQLISLFVTLLWVYLLFCHSLTLFVSDAPINWKYVVLIGITAATCCLFFCVGTRHTDNQSCRATIRSRTIING